MTKGRHPLKALERAEEIAQRRGLVHFYERRRGLLADFSITTPALKIEVKLKRMRYARCTVQWLEREAAEEIAALRMYPVSEQISRELWICSEKYFIRFFRVTANGLVELAPDGSVLPPMTRTRPPASPKTVPAPLPKAGPVPAEEGFPVTPSVGE
ncbi:MAG: hypothetical protein M0Q92_01035 [Methanoregula sp.]|jgi:hypothetical protein|nr:hypothetical protein [Methanoregula sp.]